MGIIIPVDARVYQAWGKSTARGKQLREMAEGEGRGTAGSCEGLTVSMVTQSNQERRRGLETGAGGFENAGFTKKAPSSLEKGLLGDRALPWDSPLSGMAK